MGQDRGGEGVKGRGEEVEEKGRKEWETGGGRGGEDPPQNTRVHTLSSCWVHTHPGGGKGQSSRSSLLTQKRGHTLC